jgi:phage-related protein
VAVVIGSASIRITAITREMKREITRDLNEALRDVRVDFDPVDLEVRGLQRSLSGATRETHGLGRAFRFLLPDLDLARSSGRLFVGLLGALTTASVVSLGALGGLAGAGGLVAVASALSSAAGAALLLPAALGAAGIAMATLAVGFQGMGEAFKNLDDVAKFNEAIKELSPNARSFAVAVRDMLPAFKEIRQEVQDRLFAGLAQEFSDLGRIHLPVVRQGLADMAVALNAGAMGFAAFARDKQTVADLGLLFDNSSRSAGFLAGAVQPVLSALRDIGAVGSTFLPGLAEGFTAVAERFRSFIAEARETGQLQEWISNGLAALGDLFAILGNIGSILGSILSAGQAAGAGFLNTAREITGALAGWAKSTEGQAAFASFLTAAAQAARALLPIVGSLVELISHQLAPLLAMIATTVGPSVKIVLDSIGDALDVARPGIEALAKGFASFLAAIAPALPAVGALVAVLGTGLGQVLTALGPVISQVVTILAGELGKAIPILVPGVIAFATALGDILVALAPLLPVLAQLATMLLLQPFIELAPVLEILVAGFAELVVALQPLIEALGGTLMQIMAELAPLWPVITDAILQLVPAIASLLVALLPLLPVFVQLIATTLPPLIQLFVALVVPVLSVAAAVLNVLVPALAWLLGTVVGVISGVVGWFTNLSTNVTAILNNLGAFFVGIWNFLKDTAVSAARGIADGVRSGLSSIGSLFSNAFGAARSAVSNAFANIKAAVWEGISTAVSWVAGLPGRIMGAIGNLGRLLWDAGWRLIMGLLEGIKAAAQKVWDFVSGIGGKIASLKGPLDYDRRLLVPAGLAIMQGLHDALAEGFQPVEELMGQASKRIAGSFGSPLVSTGVLPPQLPGFRPGAPSIPPAGGDGASSPADLHDAILDAIANWEVTVSAREATSKVNRINKDNATR